MIELTDWSPLAIGVVLIGGLALGAAVFAPERVEARFALFRTVLIGAVFWAGQIVEEFSHADGPLGHEISHFMLWMVFAMSIFCGTLLGNRWLHRKERDPQ